VRASLTLLALLALIALPLPAQTLDQANALQAEGRLPEAVQAYRAVAEAAAQADPATAATARNNACVLLTQLGDFRAALAECEMALRIRRAIGDPSRIARTLNNTGLCLHYLGDYDEAENRFREALEVNRLRGDAESQVINLSNLGLVATSEGRYNRALERYAAAADLASRHGSEPWAELQIHVARINQGVVLEKLGAYREALGLYREVLARDAQDAQNTRLDPRRRASLRVNTGVVYRNLGDPVSALGDFREAIRIYEAEGDKAGLSNAWLNLGLVHHLNLKQPRDAEEAYRTALRLAEESGDRSEEIQDLFYLGRLLLEQKRLDEAGSAFSRSLDEARKSGSAEGRWSALDGLGRIAAARGQEERAVELLEQAMAEIETVRGTIRRGSLRALFFGEKRPVYAAAIELLARLDARKPGAGYAERALAVVQRAKVRELLDALGGSGTAGPLGADELRAKVGDGLLLEYFLADGENRDLYLWVVRGVGRGGVELADLGPARPILDDAMAVHAALARRQEPDPARLARLSKTLLGPAGEITESEVRIAPDGALRYLPFELLPVSGTISGAPLVEQAATSYLPSGSALGWLRQLDDYMPVYTLAGLGAPDIPDKSPGGLAARYGLPPLPGAARELDSLSRLLPGRHTLLTGANDTESNFRHVVYNGVRIVHLATHTVIDERPGRGAAILFSPGGPGSDDDGLLYPEEIAGLQYRADLSVLAGCRTAVASGEGGEGDALATLTGSFLAAGSPSVLATLWEVGDDDTAAFMEQLYHELGKGRRPADALRRAKQRFREDPRWKRPDLWAGYVLIGEAPRVAYSDRMRYVIGIAVLAALALTPWFLDRKPLDRKPAAASATTGPPGGSPSPEGPARAG
jgi:CHAT domain-containing protein/tetratricopeptide (TPR) repeat protein